MKRHIHLTAKMIMDVIVGLAVPPGSMWLT